MSPESLVALSADDHFEFANDTEQVVLCDWREEPEGLVEYMNSFLPDDLKLEYAEQSDGIEITNRVGRRLVTSAGYESAAEPIPMLVREINNLLAPSHQARYFRCMDGTDSYSYLVGSIDFWSELDARYPDHSGQIFREP